MAGVSGRRGVGGRAGGGSTVPIMAWGWVCSRSEVTSGSRLSPQGQGTGWGEAQGQQPRSRGNRLKISRDVRVSRLQEVGKNAECQEEEEAKGRRQSQLKAANRLVCLFSSLWPQVSQAAVPWAWVRGTGWPRPMGGRPQTPGCMPRTPLPTPNSIETCWRRARGGNCG